MSYDCCANYEQLSIVCANCCTRSTKIRSDNVLYTSSIKIYNKYKESPRKASAYQQDESPYSSKQQQQARGKQLVSKQQQHDDNKKNNAKYKKRKQSLFINSSRTAVVVISCSYSYVLYMLQLAESVALVHNEDGWTKGCDTSLSLSLSRLASGSLAYCCLSLPRPIP